MRAVAAHVCTNHGAKNIEAKAPAVHGSPVRLRSNAKRNTARARAARSEMSRGCHSVGPKSRYPGTLRSMKTGG
jgi:hypothetical protein